MPVKVGRKLLINITGNLQAKIYKNINILATLFDVKKNGVYKRCLETSWFLLSIMLSLYYEQTWQTHTRDIKGQIGYNPRGSKKIAESFGYVATGPSGGSSHLTFRKQNSLSITIVLTQNPLKPYMISKLQAAIKNEGL